MDIAVKKAFAARPAVIDYSVKQFIGRTPDYKLSESPEFKALEENMKSLTMRQLLEAALLSKVNIEQLRKVLSEMTEQSDAEKSDSDTKPPQVQEELDTPEVGGAKDPLEESP